MAGIRKLDRVVTKVDNMVYQLYKYNDNWVTFDDVRQLYDKVPYSQYCSILDYQNRKNIQFTIETDYFLVHRPNQTGNYIGLILFSKSSDISQAPFPQFRYLRVNCSRVTNFKKLKDYLTEDRFKVTNLENFYAIPAPYKERFLKELKKT